MIENYSDYWSSACNGNQTIDICPDMDMRRWSVTTVITMLANAENYYTKKEVDNLIAQIQTSGTTPEEVEEMIQAAIATKANQADLEVLSANTYTKEEVDNKINLYSSVDDHILYLNPNNN
jgi:hypothetical protein